jgi:methyl-galactoside transport system ATP-binding protein
MKSGENLMEDKKYILEMIDICKNFPGVKALDKANLKVRAGTVHALMGENGAGKSTLMKCLFGVYIEDEGEIFIEGKKIKFSNPKQAMENGVAMVHQELNQVLQRDVMENIWLGRFPGKMGVVDSKILFNETKRVLDELEIDINPRIKMGKLSVSQRQMVEIAKAVSYNAKILVLDEPTSSLTEEEVTHLFRIINKLRDRGCGIIYISHKMEEILQISDDVTIMRDGKWIDTIEAKNLTTDKIIKLMVGRDLGDRFPPKDNKPEEVILEVKNLTGMYQPSIVDASFELRKGEILGVAGLVGSKRTELLETIFGIAKHSSGEVILHGKKVDNSNSRKAIKNGFALLTEERRATGIFGQLSINFNSIIANLDGYSSKGVLNSKKMEEDTKWVIESMRVKTPSSKTAIKTLSGGNQQKVIIGRWLLTKPEILLLDEPTRGIDVGAKYEIYQLIIDLAKKGKGVIVVSSEMPELLGICDRILVMSNGRVAGVGDTKALTQEDIMTMAAKYI